MTTVSNKRILIKLMCRLMALTAIIGVYAQKGNDKVEIKTMVHNDIERNYIIHVPSTYNSQNEFPLVLNFHGYGSNAREQMEYTKFNEISEKEGFIVVYPNGTLLEDKTHWNVGGWTLASKADDVGFVNSLIEQLQKEYSIDKKRIYAIGMSNGGYMSFLLACQLSDKIAAIASVTGSMTPQTFNNCNPTHPTPILQFHGTSDPTVPYNGNSLWTKSMRDVIDYWSEYNKTESNADISEIPDLYKDDGFTAEYYSYPKGENDVMVGHYKVNNGKHEWFGSYGNADIDSSKIIWEFLSKFNIDGRID